MPSLHIRYEGQSRDVDFVEVDLGDLSNDIQVKRAAAQHFNVPQTKFEGFIVDRNQETGDITLRPQAVFG